jgi:hypothetical protein
MNKKQFLTLLRNVQKTEKWSAFSDGNTGITKRIIEKHERFKFLSETELSDAIKQLKQFDINQLWDKQFWGLNKQDSICAVASEPYQSLLRIKSAN